MPQVRRRIEFSIPMHIMNEDANEISCTVCRDSFCGNSKCGRSQTHLVCCENPLCCQCVSKLAKRCTCTDECEAIIVFCPFCREIAGLEPLELFLGHTKTPCKSCQTLDKAEIMLIPERAQVVQDQVVQDQVTPPRVAQSSAIPVVQIPVLLATIDEDEGVDEDDGTDEE